MRGAYTTSKSCSRWACKISQGEPRPACGIHRGNSLSLRTQRKKRSTPTETLYLSDQLVVQSLICQRATHLSTWCIVAAAAGLRLIHPTNFFKGHKELAAKGSPTSGKQQEPRSTNQDKCLQRLRVLGLDQGFRHPAHRPTYFENALNDWNHHALWKHVRRELASQLLRGGIAPNGQDRSEWGARG
jgi:hypothetical protein